MFLPAQGIFSIKNCSRFCCVQEMLSWLAEWRVKSIPYLCFLCSYAASCKIPILNYFVFLKVQTQEKHSVIGCLSAVDLGHFDLSLKFVLRPQLAYATSNFSKSFLYFTVASTVFSIWQSLSLLSLLDLKIWFLNFLLNVNPFRFFYFIFLFPPAIRLEFLLFLLECTEKFIPKKIQTTRNLIR